MGEVGILEQYKPFFTETCRYNVVYGGRGKGATWNIARGILLEAIEKKHRILCTREFQNSINESVYTTLTTQIEMLGLEKYFNVQKTSIESISGSEFIFKGLRHNIDSIKSMEGITRCWIAEADKVPQDSLDKLIPTVRTEGSKFYIDFNTDSEDDPIYKMFVAQERSDTFVIFQTYQDNKYFPAVLLQDLEFDRATDQDKYQWIWEGKPRSFSEACVFHGRYVVDDFETPSDAELMHGVDWGFAHDPTAVVRCFVKDNELFIDREVGGVGIELDKLDELFSIIPTLKTWPSYADSARPETISYMRRHGYTMMKPVEKWPGSVQDGLELLKSFKRIIIHQRCSAVINEFKLYKYKRNALTGEVMPVIEDKHNHYIDALRYAFNDFAKSGRITTINKMALGL